MLSLFMQTPEVFTEEVIVDELCDFLVAGTQTTQMVTQTVLSHFATDPESLSRVRAEFDKVKSTEGGDTLREKLTMESCQDMIYLNHVI